MSFAVAAQLLAVVLQLCGCAGSTEPPFSPQDALGQFQIHPDFEVELFAAEPDVVDPVAMAFGPDRRIWVVENSGYPLDPASQRGRVKLLEDRDADGVPDAVTLYAEGLTMPTGIMPWKNGVIVTDAPDVLLLTDRDGDGRADERERLLSGFAFTNPQHTVSSPVYGLDNWIYLANEGAIRLVVFAEEFGDRGAEIHFPGVDGSPRVNVGSRCLRFRPDTLQIQPLAGASQFGLSFSEWGDVLTHNNTVHVRHEVIPARYLERNPRLRAGRTAQNVYDAPTPAAVYPITVNPRFELLSGIGQMTSAAGLTRYLGGAMPGYEDLTFVGESVHNIVHADRWEPSGSTYVARPLQDGREFLASRDPWFRPVNFSVGPDGALYVIDYYRLVIEHPEWTSAETYSSARLYDGSGRGRIWRVTPKGGLPRASPAVSDAPISELVSLLGSRNSWDRLSAQQLLVTRKHVEAKALLEDAAQDDSNPLGRLHALWTLEGLGVLDDDLVSAALGSSAAGVRSNAIRLAEPRLASAPSIWRDALVALESDPDARVRLQLLLTLGESPTARNRRLRDRMLLADRQDEWFRIAALSWPESSPTGLLRAVSDSLRPGGADAGLLEMIAGLAGNNAADLAKLVAAVSGWDEAWRQAAVLRGLRQGIIGARIRNRVGEDTREQVLKLARSADAGVRDVALDLLAAVGAPGTAAWHRALADALRTAEDDRAGEAVRVDGIRLLSLVSDGAALDMFRRFIGAGVPAAVQGAAVRAYFRVDADDAAAFLLGRWVELPSVARRFAGDAMTSRPHLAEALVGSIEDGHLMPWMLEFRSKRRLLMHSDPALRERARRLLTEMQADLKKELARYRSALARATFDAERGRRVFLRDCQDCHRLAGEGAEFGPDLGSVRTRPALNVLHDILLPNEAIAQNYESHVIELADGELMEGIVQDQGPGFVSLRRERGEHERIDRARIASMRIARLSAMPSDFHSRITPDEMADLIRYIQSAPVVADPIE